MLFAIRLQSTIINPYGLGVLRGARSLLMIGFEVRVTDEFDRVIFPAIEPATFWCGGALFWSIRPFHGVTFCRPRLSPLFVGSSFAVAAATEAAIATIPKETEKINIWPRSESTKILHPFRDISPHLSVTMRREEACFPRARQNC